ncbi:Hrp1p KNAG_0A01370 [Huiozyma naganishii CBS 8797]|uniref:RRM domain-containing protein n=1 Tax=Huiozyma naganishii (strain ATCC MYA-139 / BCRC 22969 / CBS 8797 / KCTC 17520 / NBRC 10181 / NCYC 3082 / Yp74L-3) TaxID=1071383 RepID=J7S369_HUIN7|nr:hypothetical protein KNAG_0A01370 [Kazachstania naganishii CBS 8797]CCK67826.1 hypothetical protein KNAG_0A01370 [Kazachstania naganishii CBS 8797]
MSSDDEDFNDIYGDDEQVASTTETAKEQPKAEEPTTSENASKPAEENNPAPAPAANTSSSLDQLAALQALSSNITQISKESGDSKDTKPESNTSGSSTNQTAPGAGLPWEQLQQSMSQFQQGTSNQSSTSNAPVPGPAESNLDANGHVKADISKDNCKMFIGGLNWETTEDGLREYFNKYGHVIDLKIMKDPNSGRSRGFGFLTFEEPSSVDEVVKTQHILDGKVIDPKRSIPREEQDKTGKIFVGGIGADVRPKEFEEFFSQYGTIIDAQLMLDKDTGRSRGFGFVTYDSPEAVDRVCQNKYIDFKGKQIEIKRAEPRHMQKGQYGGANPNNRGSTSGSAPVTGANMTQMFQNPMMAFNPMMGGGFNPQAMQEYYTKMQEYYQQMQQQTGMDYTQMYQQQMQQMAMMMPGFTMPQAPGGSPLDGHGSMSPPQQGAGSPNGGDGGNNGVQTIGEDGSSDQRSNSGDGTPEVNLPRGPRDPSNVPPSQRGGNSNRERGERNDRDRGNRYRSGYRNGSSGGGRRRGARGGDNSYSRRNNSGYHPYNR